MNAGILLASQTKLTPHLHDFAVAEMNFTGAQFSSFQVATSFKGGMAGSAFKNAVCSRK
jgi:hypothetical protein